MGGMPPEETGEVMKEFCSEIHLITGVVQAAGRLAVERFGGAEILAVAKDGDPSDSHHSIFTAADNEVQKYLLDQYRVILPKSRFIVEETCTGEDLIDNDNLELVKEKGRVVFIDSIDGTASFYRQRWDWSVAVNFMRDGRHCGGAIYAPAVRGGFLIRGEVGCGAFLEDGKSSRIIKVAVNERPVKKSTVFYGVDVHKWSQFMKFGNVVANAVETAVTAGSCALGVASVAAGRAEAIVQPHQWPWDWASTAIIEAAGGKVQFYHHRQGMVVPMDGPDLASYNRKDRNVSGGLGFIAGAPQLVDWLFKTLQETWIAQ